MNNAQTQNTNYKMPNLDLILQNPMPINNKVKQLSNATKSSATTFDAMQINPQSLEDTQVEYTSQKYT